MEIAARFRRYLPVVVDLETGGFDAVNNPILELACAFVDFNDGQLVVSAQHAWSVAPFPGSVVDPASLKITGIDLEDSTRGATPEKDVLQDFFRHVRQEIKRQNCTRAILVAHNAAFDQGFLNRACERTGIKRSPFHPFSVIDTASIAAVAYGHTVLSEACKRAGIPFDGSAAHRASYDTEQTARLFCTVVNSWPITGDWLEGA